VRCRSLLLLHCRRSNEVLLLLLLLLLRWRSQLHLLLRLRSKHCSTGCDCGAKLAGCWQQYVAAAAVQAWRWNLIGTWGAVQVAVVGLLHLYSKERNETHTMLDQVTKSRVQVQERRQQVQ
jgi:hypothetical protein